MAQLTTKAKESAHRLLRRMGYDLLPYTLRNFADLRRAKILGSRKITLVLDVGANEGQYAQRIRGTGYPGRVHSFEPVSAAFERLAEVARSDPRWQCERLALGDSDGQADIHVGVSSECSSLLELDTPLAAREPNWRLGSSEQVTVARLDTLAPSLFRGGDCAWLKMDVQGYEMQVLRGSPEALDRVEVIEVELSLAPLYKGQALFPDIVTFLDRNGFRLASLEPAYVDEESGEVMQVDGVFVRHSKGG